MHLSRVACRINIFQSTTALADHRSADQMKILALALLGPEHQSDPFSSQRGTACILKNLFAKIHNLLFKRYLVHS